MHGSSEIGFVAPIAASDAILPVSAHPHGQYRRQQKQQQQEQPKEEKEADTVELSEQARIDHHLQLEASAEEPVRKPSDTLPTETHLDIAV